MSHITIRDYYWKRTFSNDPEPVLIPAGSKLNKTATTYWVKSNNFPDQPILQHDLNHYGCAIDENNVKEIKDGNPGI